MMGENTLTLDEKLREVMKRMSETAEEIQQEETREQRRYELAKEAMGAILSSSEDCYGPDRAPSVVAHAAFDFADAMLAELEKKG